MLRMRAAIYLAVRDGETKSEAEDRMIERLEKEGVTLVGWDASDIIDIGDMDEEEEPHGNVD